MLNFMLYIFSHYLHLGLTVRQSSSFPEALEPEEERRLFELSNSGDDSAREKLILHNLRLVSHIVRKYYPSAPNPDDLNSIGTIGLVKAVDSFKPDKGPRFATYAGKCIQNAIIT